MYIIFANTGIQFIELPYLIDINLFVQKNNIDVLVKDILVNSFTPLTMDGSTRDYIRVFWRDEKQGDESSKIFLRPILVIDTNLGSTNKGALDRNFDIGKLFTSSTFNQLYNSSLDTTWDLVLNWIVTEKKIRIDVHKNLVNIYVEFLKKLIQSELEDYFKIDSNYTKELFDINKSKLGEFKLLTIEENNPIETSLYFDLGNTRSVGLIFENSNGLAQGFSPFRPFELINYTNYFATKRLKTIDIDSTIFSSHIQFRKSPFPEYSFSETFQLLSITSVGVEAFDFKMIPSDLDTNTGVSGPKRYIWDQKSTDYDWFFANRKQTKISGAVLKYFSLSDKDEFRSDYSSNPVNPNYPRRALISHFVIELLEQAFRQVNSVSHRLHAQFLHSRKLKRIVFSYPSGITDDLKLRYLKQIKKGVYAFKEFFKVGNDIEVELGLDEASAAQVVLLKSLNKRYANKFNQFVQKTLADDGKYFNLASIDIGGGTTDVMIAKYDVDKLLHQNIIHGTIEFVDGVENGGDDLVKLIIDLIFNKLLLEQGIISETVKNYIYDQLQTKNRIIRLQLLHAVLRPIAIAYIMSLTDINLRQKLEKKKPLFNLIEEDLSHFKVIDSIKNQNEVKKKLTQITEINKTLSQEINFAKVTSEDIIERIVKSDLFRKVIVKYTNVISQYSPEYLIIAGKLSSIPQIIDEIKKYLPTTPDRVITLDKFRTGKWYPFNNNNKISDPKTTVVVGCAIADVAKRWGFIDGAHITIDKSDKFANKTFYLTNSPSLELDPTYIVLKHDQSISREITLSSKKMTISTSLLVDLKGIYVNPAYELSLIDGYSIDVQNQPVITLKQEDSRLIIESIISGRIKDDKNSTLINVSKEHISLKLKTIREDDYYLDSGVI